MTDIDVAYTCGCLGSEVGQAFDTGLLVCPTHRQPVAPFKRPDERHRAQVTVTVTLDCHNQEQAERWEAALVDTLDRDNNVTGIVSSLEHIHPARSAARS